MECLWGRPLRALPHHCQVFVCLVNDAQARGALVPTVETITRLGLTVAFVIGLYGHGPMVCLELSGVHVQSFAHKKLARLSELLDYNFPSCHSGYACKLHHTVAAPICHKEGLLGPRGESQCPGENKFDGLSDH